MENFQEIFSVEDTEYGIISGNSTVFFIKAGQGGNIYGYENKYLQIATNANKKYGYTVICASNHWDRKNNPLKQDGAVINECCRNTQKIYYMGVSNGGIIGAIYGHLYPQITRLLLINPPLFINWPRIKRGLQGFQGEKGTIVVGELDASYRFADLIKLVNNHRIHVTTIANADHNFKGKLSEFINLPEQYLFDTAFL